MAGSEGYVLLFLVLFSCFINSCYAYQFIVGWVLNPSENYNHWAQRNRFQINDTLLFKYKSGSDSVLVVNNKDYESCNTGNPILKLEGENSVFKFDRSGPFYFISGNSSHCHQGQKLIVVVLAVRNRPPKSASPPMTGASAPEISPSPSVGSTAPSASPSTWSPAPEAGSPWSPSPSTGAPSPSIMASSPSPSSGAPSPSVTALSPSPVTGAPTPGISGSDQSPTGSPNSTTPGSGTPSDVNSPGGSPRRSLALPTCTPSILIVSLVLSVAFGGLTVSN